MLPIVSIAYLATALSMSIYRSAKKYPPLMTEKLCTDPNYRAYLLFLEFVGADRFNDPTFSKPAATYTVAIFFLLLTALFMIYIENTLGSLTMLYLLVLLFLYSMASGAIGWIYYGHMTNLSACCGSYFHWPIIGVGLSLYASQNPQSWIAIMTLFIALYVWDYVYLRKYKEDNLVSKASTRHALAFFFGVLTGAVLSRDLHPATIKSLPLKKPATKPKKKPSTRK